MCNVILHVSGANIMATVSRGFSVRCFKVSFPVKECFFNTALFYK